MITPPHQLSSLLLWTTAETSWGLISLLFFSLNKNLFWAAFGNAAALKQTSVLCGETAPEPCGITETHCILRREEKQHHVSCSSSLKHFVLILFLRDGVLLNEAGFAFSAGAFISHLFTETSDSTLWRKASSLGEEMTKSHWLYTDTIITQLHTTCIRVKCCREQVKL